MRRATGAAAAAAVDEAANSHEDKPATIISNHVPVFVRSHRRLRVKVPISPRNKSIMSCSRARYSGP